jgi:hypothetical protein
MFNLKTLVKTAAITAAGLAFAPAAFADGHTKVRCAFNQSYQPRVTRLKW